MSIVIRDAPADILAIEGSSLELKLEAKNENLSLATFSTVKAIEFQENFCEAYTWPDLGVVEYFIGDKELPFVLFDDPSPAEPIAEELVTISDCRGPDLWDFTATLEDGTPLPSSITFDASNK